eukprot:Gb_03696 [translate_table: standard]
MGAKMTLIPSVVKGRGRNVRGVAGDDGPCKAEVQQWAKPGHGEEVQAARGATGVCSEGERHDVEGSRGSTARSAVANSHEGKIQTSDFQNTEEKKYKLPGKQVNYDQFFKWIAFSQS